MRTNFKNLIALIALATNVTLASCQSEPIEPKVAPAKKTTETHPVVEEDGDNNAKPPKTGNGGGDGN